MAIIDLDKIQMHFDPDVYPKSKIHKRVEKLIKKHQERNANWERRWHAYKHLPEEIKEEDRSWAKRKYEILQGKTG